MRMFRLGRAVTALCFATSALAADWSTQADFNIKPQKLATALVQFSRQANTPVVSATNDVEQHQSPGVNGTMSLKEALNALLAGSQLESRLTESGAIAIGNFSSKSGAAAFSSKFGQLLMAQADDRGALSPTGPPAVIGDQAPGDQSGAAGMHEEAGKLEEIVVTAQKRVERLQEVPISAQVIGGRALSEQNINSLYTVAATVPSVQISDGGGRTTNLYMRGIGSGNNQSFDQSVGVFIDDIYHGRSRITAGTFLDLERVEILKGPQSTFFGNNAIAGAFNIITRKPGEEFDASVRALYGEHGHYAVEGAAGGPLGDLFAARVAATANGQRGWIENVVTGKHVPDEDSKAARVTLAFKPTENFDATLKAEAASYDQIGALYLTVRDCPPSAPFTTGAFCAISLAANAPMGEDVRKISRNPGDAIEMDTRDYVLTADYRLGELTLSSVTGYYNYQYNLDFDLDFTSSRLINAQTPEKYHQFSQELRVVSPAGRTIEYLFGAYYQTGKLELQQNSGYFVLSPLITANLPPLVPYLPIGQSINFDQREDSYAVFGSATWNVTDQWKLSAALRGSRVEKKYSNLFFFGTAAQDYGGIVALPDALQPIASLLGLGRAYAPSGSRRDDEWLPSFKAQYQINPDAMAYVSYAEGFKSGGFNGVDNTGDPNNIPYEPEHVDAYEMGVKSEWFDDRVLVNLAVFLSEYKNLQVAQNRFTATGGIVGSVRNAAASRSKGVELESQWAVSTGLRLAANVSYIDSRYVSYPNVSLTEQQTFCRTNYVLPYCDGVPNPVPALQDVSGKPTAFAPKWSGSLTANYGVSLPGGYRWTTELTGLYSSKAFLNTTADPYFMRASYVRLDGRMSFEAQEGHWAVDLIGKNLTDRKILTYLTGMPFAAGSHVQQLQEPRNLALQLRYQW